jgi:hypothetical protein
MSKIAILRTGFITKRNFNNLINNINFHNNQNIDTFIFTWDVFSDKEKLSNSVINILNKITKGVYVFNYNEYEKNKILYEIKKENRLIPIKELLDMKPGEVNDIWGTEQKTIPEAKTEFFEYWLNKLKDQYYTVYEGINFLKNLDYEYIIRVRSDINISDLPIYTKEGIHVPYCPYHGHKDHIVQGDTKSMVKYSNLYNVIQNIYPITHKDLSMQNQCAECLLKYYIEDTEPKLNFDVHTDFYEYKNYQIIK